MSKDAVELFLPMDGYGQPNTKTCWFACYAMMYAWKKKTVVELKQKLTDKGYDLSRLLSRGLDQHEYGKICHAAGLSDLLRVQVLSWSMGDLIHRLSFLGPIYVATTKYAGHAMVVYAASGKTGTLKLADPYTRGEFTDAHTEYYTLDGFKEIVQPIGFALQVLW